MRAFKFYNEPDELTPEQEKILKIIVVVVGVGMVFFLSGLLCLLIAYTKCNCHAV